MTIRLITKKELLFVHAVLLGAILLQGVVWLFTESKLSLGSPLIIIVAELLLILATSFSALGKESGESHLHRLMSIGLIGTITVTNIGSLALVVNNLITHSSTINGYDLLLSAIAIFLTNIIVFSLWYWEIDSPGLTGKTWSKHDKDFQFTQHDMPAEFPNWQPQFSDYLYLSVTNAINFAPADARPLTRNAKLLMGTQALVSVFTLALLIARSVTILGN